MGKNSIKYSLKTFSNGETVGFVCVTQMTEERRGKFFAFLDQCERLAEHGKLTRLVLLTHAELDDEILNKLVLVSTKRPNNQLVPFCFFRAKNPVQSLTDLNQKIYFLPYSNSFELLDDLRCFYGFYQEDAKTTHHAFSNMISM